MAKYAFSKESVKKQQNMLFPRNLLKHFKNCFLPGNLLEHLKACFLQDIRYVTICFLPGNLLKHFKIGFFPKESEEKNISNYAFPTNLLLKQFNYVETFPYSHSQLPECSYNLYYLIKSSFSEDARQKTMLCKFHGSYPI